MTNQPSPKQASAEVSDESSRSASSSKLDTSEQDPTLVFSCRCSNVTITGRLTSAEPKKQGGLYECTLEELHLGTSAEKAKHPIYVGYDAPEPERRSRRLSHSGDGEAAGSGLPVWRVCWMCDTKLYQVEGKRKGDAAIGDGVVAIDRHSGIVIKSDAGAPTCLPYSDLALPIPRSSNFGRPPRETLKTVYPAPASPTSHPTTHLPMFADPFFLPPPFIPSHPHLRDLCGNAVDYLRACHHSSEVDVKNYIAVKAQELRELEEKVRAEVELMWDKYVQGPGREDVRERERRRSESIGVSADRKGKGRDKSGRFGNSELSGISPSPIPDNPIMREAALATFPTGASLLSASISQMSYMPRTAAVPDEADDTIDEVARTYDKQGDQRAMAMSYVFSNLDGVMAGKTEGPEPKQELHGRDSWVDEERTEAWRRERKAVEKHDPPKHSALAGHNERRMSEGKKKGKVSFEEPVGQGEEEPREDDDYVFDFELEDRATVPRPAEPTAETKPTRNLLEETLSSTYASNAPSHRAAHLRLMAGEKDTYSPLRRRFDASGGDDATVSKLATSVPMPIGFRGSNPGTPRAPPYAFERKTSLSDRQGMMVPPLMKAMRQRGLDDGNSLGLTSPKPAPALNEASTSKVAYKADPGAVLGSMGDGEEEEQVGTLKGSGFIPPHVLARKESMQSGDVGWRSMISD